MFQAFFILLCFLFFPAWATGSDLTQLTQKALSRFSQNNKANIEPLKISSCSAGFAPSLSFRSDHSDIEFKVQINSEISSPEVQYDSQSRTLQIPSLETLKADSLPESLKSTFNNWLIGHEFHPYSSGFSTVKSSQKTALQASILALKEGASSLLNIAPTGMGKTYVLLQTLMTHIREFSNHQKIFIFTVHQLELIEQLLSQLKEEQERGEDFHIVDWRSLLDKSWKSFADEIKHADERNKPTVLLISSQSLTRKLRKFFNQTEKKYKDIQNTLLGGLGGIYIDEAHHLGADKTKSTLLELLNESRSYQKNQGVQNEVFLYGTTATPVHYAVNLREFFEREHWAYLNKEDHLFEKHNVEFVLEQLALGIDKGELTPFNDLYVIGENSFKKLAQESGVKESSVFIKLESRLYVINPDHYENLLRIMKPLLSSNKKGFIVTATIAEAERLQNFLNKANTGITFEAYHSKMEDQTRREILERSRTSKDPHYIIAVRALDEGVNLPHLSAYIDINSNVPILQMIHRIGRVLRIFPGKQIADILFLTDYKNEQFAKDALSILDKLEVLSFSGASSGKKEISNRNLKFKEADITPMSREELLEMRDRLQESVRRFWAERYTLEEVPEAVSRLNEISPETEQITNLNTYDKFHHKDPRLPPWTTLANWYIKKHGNAKGLLNFILNKTGLYSLEEIPEIFLKLIHENSIQVEQITNIQKTYEEFHPKDPRLPSWNTLQIWYKNKYGNLKGLSSYIVKNTTRKHIDRTKIELYSLEEVPEAVARLNEISPETEQLTNLNTYDKFHHKDPKLPSMRTLIIWFKNKYGSLELSLHEFIFMNQTKFNPYNLSLDKINENLETFLVNNLEDQYAHEQKIKILRKTIKKIRPLLNERENYILSYHILSDNPQTLQTIGKKFKISRERARQIESKLLNKIKKQILSELKPIEPNRTYTESEKPYYMLIDVSIKPIKPPPPKSIQKAVEKLNETELTELNTYMDFYNTYTELRDKDSTLPSWYTLQNWYKQQYGNNLNFPHSILSEKLTN